MSKSISRRAVIAAAQGSEAVTELLRFHVEGPAGDTAFGDIEVVEKLAEALAVACDIEFAVRLEQGLRNSEQEYEEALEDLRSVARSFVEEWCG